MIDEQINWSNDPNISWAMSELNNKTIDSNDLNVLWTMDKLIQIIHDLWTNWFKWSKCFMNDKPIDSNLLKDERIYSNVQWNNHRSLNDCTMIVMKTSLIVHFETLNYMKTRFFPTLEIITDLWVDTILISNRRHIL